MVGRIQSIGALRGHQAQVISPSRAVQGRGAAVGLSSQCSRLDSHSFPSDAVLPDSVASRLKFLLNHSNILRPQYHFTEHFDNIWGETKEITAVLQDPEVIRGTYPYSDVGKCSTV